MMDCSPHNDHRNQQHIHQSDSSSKSPSPLLVISLSPSCSTLLSCCTKPAIEPHHYHHPFSSELSSNNSIRFSGGCSSSKRMPHQPHHPILWMGFISLLCLLLVPSLEAAITEQCLSCICHASTGCDINRKCHTTADGGYFCGAYQISWAYWEEAGRPGDEGRPHDFETCLNNKVCAEATIVNYMNKFAADCNNDGSINCVDFAVMHKTGRASCSEGFNGWLTGTDYWKSFSSSSCMATSTAASRSRPRPGRQNPNRSDREIFLDDILPPNARHPFHSPLERTHSDHNRRHFISQPFNDPPSNSNRRSISFPDGRNSPPINRRNSQPAPPQNHNRILEPPDSHLRSFPPENIRSRSSRVSWVFNETSPHQPPPPNSLPHNNPGPPVRVPFGPSRDPNEPFGGSNHWFHNHPSPNSHAPTRPSSPPSNNFIPPPPPSSNGNFAGNFRSSDERPSFDRSRPIPFSPPPSSPPSPPATSSGSFSPSRGPIQPSNSISLPERNNLFENFAPTRTAGSRTPRVLSSTQLVEPSCLSCLCSASTGCDLTPRCQGEFCGPYLLSWSYWSDGGRPGGDFLTCAHNKGCSEDAIQAYMRKWTRDCNGDGVVDCDDFAAIHKLGPHMCRSESLANSPYWRQYEKCSSSRALNFTSPVVTPPNRGIFNDIPAVNHFPIGLNELTTNRPPMDLPLITPRRRLHPIHDAGLNNNHVGPSSDLTPSSPVKPQRESMSRSCMECICEAASGCNLQETCSASGRNEVKRCGPYQLDWNQWTQSGSRGNSQEFERCSRDKECAEDVISRFMTTHSYDCNEDGVIDCLDFAAIHRGGTKSCNSQWFLESPFWSSFEQCYGFSARR